MKIKRGLKAAINHNQTIYDAIKKIDLLGIGFAAVTDKKNRLLGVLTDADIRKSILSGINKDDSVKKIMNTNFIFAKKGINQAGVENLMRDSGKTHSTKAGAIADMKRDNSRWMKKNYSDEWARKANFQYGAVPDGKFADGSEGNKKLLKWHDASQEGRKELLGKKGFMRGQLQDQLSKTNQFAKKVFLIGRSRL